MWLKSNNAIQRSDPKNPGQIERIPANTVFQGTNVELKEFARFGAARAAKGGEIADHNEAVARAAGTYVDPQEDDDAEAKEAERLQQIEAEEAARRKKADEAQKETEAAAKKKADAEAAAAKKKADDEAAAKKKADDEAAKKKGAGGGTDDLTS